MIVLIVCGLFRLFAVCKGFDTGWTYMTGSPVCDGSDSYPCSTVSIYYDFTQSYLMLLLLGFLGDGISSMCRSWAISNIVFTIHSS